MTFVHSPANASPPPLLFWWVRGAIFTHSRCRVAAWFWSTDGSVTRDIWIINRQSWPHGMYLMWFYSGWIEISSQRSHGTPVSEKKNSSIWLFDGALLVLLISISARSKVMVMLTSLLVFLPGCIYSSTLYLGCLALPHTVWCAGSWVCITVLLRPIVQSYVMKGRELNKFATCHVSFGPMNIPQTHENRLKMEKFPLSRHLLYSIQSTNLESNPSKNS